MIHLQFSGHPDRGYWDQSLIQDLFEDIEGVVLIPAKDQATYLPQINEELNKLPYCAVLVMSDEESGFPVELLSHPKMKVWLQYPKENQKADHYLPAGYSPGVREVEVPPKTLNWFWGGQVTHEDRYELVDQLRTMTGGYLLETPGFAQGFPLMDYLKILASSKIVPCPRGAVSPDTMRLYDALELGCTPVIRKRDEVFFRKILGSFPFPVIDRWSDLPNVTYQDYRGWWNAHKNSMARKMVEDLSCLQQ